MKKTLVALAVLAASGAAMAQVTLYGVVDLAYGTTNAPGANSSARMHANDSYTDGTSRWGIKSVEDLGDGLKFTAQFEQALNYTTGAATVASGRAAFGALSGGFGEVRIGRTLTPEYYGTSAWELTNMANFSAVTNLWGYAGASNARNDSQLSYTSPKLNGFSGTLAYVAEQDDTQNAQTGTTSSKVSANAIYAQGPLSVALSYWKLDKVAPGASTDGNYSLGLNYNFGSFILAASYQDPAGPSQGYTLGGTIPAGLWKFTADVGQDTAYSQTNYLLYAGYSLSKRTTLYFDYNRFGKTGDLSKPVRSFSANNAQDIDQYGLGFRHNF